MKLTTSLEHNVEARIQGHYCIPYTNGVELAAMMLAEKPNDIHTVTGKRIGIARSDAKSVNYACIFGAQPAKLAKMLNCDQQRANDIFDAFWESVPALQELKDKLEKHWETLGKTHIKGLDGRLLCTRSKHSLVNVAFQSGGAITVKWSIVRILQKMQEAGILGNPFEHTADQIKVWQMIVNHDEGQYAVHPKLLNVRVFKTDEEAEQFVKENPGCSAIGHGSKGPYVALETLPVTCIKEGIEVARRELKIRVDLGIEYIVGKSWAQCH